MKLLLNTIKKQIFNNDCNSKSIDCIFSVVVNSKNDRKMLEQTYKIKE